MTPRFLYLSLFISSFFSLKAEEQVPLTWKEHFNTGIEFFQKGELEGALSSFEKASTETDLPQLVHYNRALTHQALGEQDLAEEQYHLVLHEDQPLLSMKAHYQMGHLFFDKATTSANTESEEAPSLDLEVLEDSSFHFRECQDLYYRHESLLGSEGKQLHDKAKRNDLKIAARYKYMMDQLNKKRGEKARIIQGTVKVNGRAVDRTRVYIKSKWEERIYGHTFSDNTGGYLLEDLPVGKYQLAAALYDTEDTGDLKWETEIKVPTRTEDTHDLNVHGAQTLAMPYQSSGPSLSAPWDDHLREGGGETLQSAPHWGELTDGYPEASLSDNNDLNKGYVAFDAPRIQIAMAVPERGSPDGSSPSPPASSDNVQPPKYQITLRGFVSEDSATPDTARFLGLAPPNEENSTPQAPTELSVQKVEVSKEGDGTYTWTSELFEHQGFRSVLMDFERTRGKRMSFHEIEVLEIIDEGKQEQDQQDDQQDQSQDQQDDQQEQSQPEQKKEETSRSTRAILQDIRKKNEDAKERQTGSGIIISTDTKDF